MSKSIKKWLKVQRITGEVYVEGREFKRQSMYGQEAYLRLTPQGSRLAHPANLRGHAHRPVEAPTQRNLEEGLTMDQFPHDNCPKDKDQPERPRTDIRLVHAKAVAPSRVQLSLSPVIGERHTMTQRQAMALARELVRAISVADPCALTLELERTMEQECKDYEVRDDD